MNTIIERENSILVVVDIQERLTPSMDSKLWDNHLNHIRFVSQAAEKLSVPSILTEQYPRGLGNTIPEIAELNPRVYTERIEKTEFSCAQNALFQEKLKKLIAPMTSPWIVLLGIETHVCILQTALDLLDQGLRVAVVQDGTCSRSENNHLNAIRRLEQRGVIITNAESLVFEWLRDAKNPHFREISNLLKAIS